MKKYKVRLVWRRDKDGFFHLDFPKTTVGYNKGSEVAFIARFYDKSGWFAYVNNPKFIEAGFKTRLPLLKTKLDAIKWVERQLSANKECGL